MPIIKPISDLQRKSNEISELANQVREPIFLTKNGEGDLVLMSMAYYSELQLKIDLYAKLSEADAQVKAGKTGKPLKQVLRNVRKMIHESRKV